MMARSTEQRALRDDELLIERTFDAPVPLVFRIWEDRDHMQHWLGPKDFTCTELDMDFRPGGKWRGKIVAEAYGESGMSGEYRKIEKNRKIVYTFAWDEDSGPGIETLVTVTFEDDGRGRTIQRFHQTPFASAESRDSHVSGWNECFDREQAYAEKLAVERVS
jgi:uncharacterized protein YndB with AHSA1/START domain